jgi:WD40 repeat protein/tetratricopeptide (TPR) repeat protein
MAGLVAAAALAAAGAPPRADGPVPASGGARRLPAAASPADYHAKYAVIVGIDGYPGGDTDLEPLGNAANDAREFRRLLVEEFGYDDDKIRYLTDAQGEPEGVVDGQPTLENVRDAFTEWLPAQEPQPDDSVLVFFAGHGLRDGYLAASDSRADAPETCIAIGQLKSWLGGGRGGESRIPCRHRLVLLDCCFSGMLFSEPLVARPQPQAGQQEGGRADGAGVGPQPSGRGDGSRASREVGEVGYYLSREAFVGMSAGLGDQPVADGTGEDRHSFFTKELLQAMRERANSAREDHVFTFTELASVVRPRVAAAVLRVDPLLEQNPMAGRVEAGEGDFVFRQSVDTDVPWEIDLRMYTSLAISRGDQALQQKGDTFSALAWFAEPLGRLDDEVAHRRRIAIHRWSTHVRPTLLFRPFAPTGGDRHVGVRFVRDGQQLMTHSEITGEVRFWDAQTGRQVGPTIRHPELRRANPSPDGRRLAILTRKGSLSVWDVDTGKEVLQRLQKAGPVGFVAFSPDGRWLLAAGAERRVRVCDAATGRLRYPPLEHDAPAVGGFTPDGRYIVTGTVKAGQAQVWDAETGKPLTDRQSEGLIVWPALVAVNVSGTDFYVPVSVHVATGEVRAWDVAGGKPGGPKLEAAGRPYPLKSISRDGRRLLMAAGNGAAVWDLLTGRQLGSRTFDGHVNHLLFGPDGRTVICVFDSTRVAVWDGLTGAELMPPVSQVTGWDLSPDTRRVTLVTNAELVRVLDFVEPESRDGWVKGGDLAAELFRTSPDGRHWLTAGGEPAGPRETPLARARLWDASNGTPVAPPLELGAGPGLVAAVFSPDGRRLVGGCGSVVRVWEVPSGERRADAPPLPAAVMAGAVLDGGGGGATEVLAVCVDGAIRAWDGASDEWTTLARHPEEVTAAALSPDGRRALTAGETTALLWDTTSGAAPLGNFPDAPKPVASGAFNRDGTRVVVVSWNRHARLWNANTGRPAGPPIPTDRLRHPPALSPDGRLVATSRDGGVVTLDATTGVAVSPGVEVPGPVVALAFDPSGDLLYVSGGRFAIDPKDDTRGVRVVDLLSPEPLPAADLRRLLNILSGVRVDAETAGMVPIETEQLLREWDDLRPRYPKEFSVGVDEAAAWHRRRFHSAWSVGDASTFLVNLRSLMAISRHQKNADVREQYFEDSMRFGLSMAGSGRLEEAADVFREATQLVPTAADAHYSLAIVLMDLGRSGEAESACREAVRLEPEHLSARVNLAGLLADSGRLEAGVAELREVVGIAPKDAGVHRNLGILLRRSGRFRAALEEFRQARALESPEPDWAANMDVLIEHCEELTTLEERLAGLLRGTEPPRDNAERLLLARHCYDVGRFASAAQFWGDALDREPNLGDDRDAQHRYWAAGAAVLAAAGRDPNDPAPDAASRAALRGRALRWLQGERDFWAGILTSDSRAIRQTVAEVLQGWRSDPDLATVRDELARAELSDDECAAWQSLWSSIAALLALAGDDVN